MVKEKLVEIFTVQISAITFPLYIGIVLQVPYVFDRNLRHHRKTVAGVVVFELEAFGLL